MIDPTATRAERAYRHQIGDHRRAAMYAPPPDSPQDHERAAVILARAMLAELADPAPALDFPPCPEWPRPFVPMPDGMTCLAYLPPRDQPMP
jgi:hypothetical protein